MQTPTNRAEQNWGLGVTALASFTQSAALRAAARRTFKGRDHTLVTGKIADHGAELNALVREDFCQFD
ncbi:hypothetical protein [Bradyrhizobium sp. USDA 4486]